MARSRPRSDDDAPSVELTDDEKIVREGKKRFKRCDDWESVARKRWLEDTKFVNGDAYNMYQWPGATQQARGFGTEEERPCLTVNKTHQHCLQIINDQRQNKTSISVKPTGDKATFESAQVIEGIVRHIEYISDAQAAYGTATRHQVQGGIGYWRVVTDYADENSFDQEIFIRRVKDPLTVYVDPDFEHADGSDMNFAFVYNDMARDLFDAEYPEFKDKVSPNSTPLDNDDGWIKEDTVRVAEYFRVVHKPDKLIIMRNEAGEEFPVKESEVAPELREAFEEALKDPNTRTRDVLRRQVQWFKIAGDIIIERRDWAGRYIPIVRVPGEETVIDGEMDRKGQVRALLDPQRMYNYNASAQIEFGALQNKIPYIAPAAAIESQETYWNNANRQNFSVLPYNHMDDAGAPIPAPQRAQPPAAAQAYEVSMRNAAEHMMMVSGQYQANFGAPGNERSGVAIEARQRQGDNATYHFIDHFSMAVRFTGKIIIDLIPKIYDTKRVIKIMAEDGTASDVLIDPKAAQAYFKRKAELGETAEEVVFNPNVGRYEVVSDVGPAYATRRQEAWNAFSQIAVGNKELMALIGDLMFKNADFPGADEIAERLKRMVPAQAMGDGPPPEVIQLQGQVQTLQQMLQFLGGKLEDKERELSEKGGKNSIDAYRAETDRIETLKEFMVADREGLMALIQQVVAEALSSSLVDVEPEPMPMTPEVIGAPVDGFMEPVEGLAQ